MAKGDIISRLRLDSGEFDAKIKRAGQELLAYSEHCKKMGLEMGYANKDAKEFAKAQFAQYGMPSAPEEMVANFAKQILENKEQAEKIYEKLYELKVVEFVKSKIKVTSKAVTSEEFAKLAQEQA